MARGRARRASDSEAKAGGVIRAARLHRGWSQARLADELEQQLGDGETVSQGTVSNWEHGLATPTPNKVPTVERILRINPGELARLYFGVSVDGPGDDEDLDARLKRLEDGQREIRDLLTSFLAWREEDQRRSPGKSSDTDRTGQ